MSRLPLLFLFLFFSFWTTPAAADDALTVIYSANSVGEYAPCPT